MKKIDGYVKNYKNLRYYKKLEIIGNTNVKIKPSFISPTDIPFGDINITLIKKDRQEIRESIIIPRMIDYAYKSLIIEMNKLGAKADKIKAVKKGEKAIYLSKTTSMILTGKEKFYQAQNEKGKNVYCLRLEFSVKNNVGYSTHFKKMKRPIYKDCFAVNNDVLIFRTNGKESLDDFIEKITECYKKGKPVKIILAKSVETEYSIKNTCLGKALLNLKAVHGDLIVVCTDNSSISKLKLCYVRWNKLKKKTAE